MPLPIWVKPNIALSNQTGRGPRWLKNRKAQTLTYWPEDHTSETASKLYTSSIIDTIPRVSRPCRIIIRIWEGINATNRTKLAVWNS